MSNSSERFPETQRAAIDLIAGHPKLQDDEVTAEVIKTGMFGGEQIDVGNFLAAREKELENEPNKPKSDLTPEDFKPVEASGTWRDNEQHESL